MENRRIRSTPLETLNSKGFITFYIILIVLLPVIFLFLEKLSASREEPYSAFALAYMTAVFLSFLLIYYVDKYHRYMELYKITKKSVEELQEVLFHLSLINDASDDSPEGKIVLKYKDKLEYEYKNIIKKTIKIISEDKYNYDFELEKYKHLIHNRNSLDHEVFCQAVIIANKFDITYDECDVLMRYLKDFARYDIYYDNVLFYQCINNQFPSCHDKYQYQKIQIPDNYFVDYKPNSQ